MMEVSAGVLKEADVLLAAALTGAALMFAYDLIRIFRRIVPHGAGLVGAEDLLFWIGAAAALFAMLCRENSGRIRGFSILGVLLGMLAYAAAFGPWLVRAGAYFLGKLFHAASRPVVWAARLLGRPFGVLRRRWKKISRFLKKQLKKICKAVRIGLCKI